MLFARQWSFAVAGPANAVFAHLTRLDDESSSLVRDALGALNPFVYYLLLGALQHAVLRACGSQRRLRDSSAALAGLHERDGIRSRHIVLANTVAFVVTGLAFAIFQPSGSFGLHLFIGPVHGPHGWHFGWGLGD